MKTLTSAQISALKIKITDLIKDEDKTVLDISAYALNRLASKSYDVTIFWKGRTVKGSNRFAKLHLGCEVYVAIASMGIMEELIDDASSYSIIDELEEPNTPVPVTKFGNTNANK